MICTRCQEDKPAAEYSPAQSMCKTCRRARDKERKMEITAFDRVGEPRLGLHARHMAALRERRVWFGSEKLRPDWLKEPQEQAA